MHSDNLTPEVADVRVDARGFGLAGIVSCGCGGGVTR